MDSYTIWQLGMMALACTYAVFAIIFTMKAKKRDKK